MAAGKEYLPWLTISRSVTCLYDFWTQILIAKLFSKHYFVNDGLSTKSTNCSLRDYIVLFQMRSVLVLSHTIAQPWPFMECASLPSKTLRQCSREITSAKQHLELRYFQRLNSEPATTRCLAGCVPLNLTDIFLHSHRN